MTNHTTPTGTPLITVPAARHLTTAYAATAPHRHLPRLDLDRRIPRRPHRHRLPRRPPGPHPRRRRPHPPPRPLRLRNQGPALAHPRRRQQPRPTRRHRRPRHHRLHHRRHLRQTRRHRQPGTRSLGQPRPTPSSPSPPPSASPTDQPLDDTIKHNPLDRFLNTLRAPAPERAKDLPNWAEILIIAAAFGVALHVFTYGIDTEYAELFIGYIISVAFGFTALNRAGLISRITRLTTKHRNVTLAAALVAAFCFPFTQQNEQYALIGANILIFATVALGLNVVVGLAGLLDLGYVAFLGVGAYAAALVSGSPLSPVGVQFPFWAAVLTGAAALTRLRRRHRRPDPATARRLPRHRHPRLRRDLPPHRQRPQRRQRPRPHQRLPGHPQHPRPQPLRLRLRHQPRHRRIHPRQVSQLLPADARLHRRRRPGLPTLRRIPHRPRLGRHPRGRDRRHRHGHQRLPAQAPRLRPRRHPRRTRRYRPGPRLLHRDARAVPVRLPYPRTPPSSSPPSSSAAWEPSADPSSARPSSTSSRPNSNSCRTTSSSSSASR